MKDPLPQKDNPYTGPVAPKRQPLTQDMSDMNIFLKCWLSSKKGRYLCPKPPLYSTNPYAYIPINPQIHKSTNIHKSQKYKEKIRMVYLCVQAWLWYDKAVKKVYNGKMSEYLHQNHKKKNICYPNVPLKEKQKKKGLHQNELFNA